MNAKAWARLERLSEVCGEALRDPQRQSATIFRGDMWAVIGAHHDIKKARAMKEPRKEKIALVASSLTRDEHGEERATEEEDQPRGRTRT